MEHKIQIISNSKAESGEIRKLITDASYLVSESIIADGSIIEFNQPDVEIYIVILSPGFQQPRGAGEYAVTSSNKLVLYVTSSNLEEVRLWAFRQGATEVLTRPFTSTELQFRLERMIVGDVRRFQANIDERQMLDFLGKAIQDNIGKIEPALDPFMPSGHFYPYAAGVVGRTPCDVELLERITTEGLLTRKVVNRVRLCPVCDDMRINYREVCPGCSSVNILNEDMIHHFSCAHIGVFDSFKRGSELVCPKCEVLLRHIGLDYEKPVGKFSCQDCKIIFSDAHVECQCVQCGNVCNPGETFDRPVYSYEVNDLAVHAVSEGRIGGMDLQSLLRSTHTGLYSRQYFEHELEREMVRYRRYNMVFSVLLIRIEDLDHVRTEHSAQASEYVNSIFKALSERLRDLDTTCVWDIDKLAVLLSATAKDGGSVVAQRMHENVKGLEYLYSIHEPRVTISLVSVDDGYETSDNVINAALRDLDI